MRVVTYDSGHSELQRSYPVFDSGIRRKWSTIATCLVGETCPWPMSSFPSQPISSIVSSLRHFQGEPDEESGFHRIDPESP